MNRSPIRVLVVDDHPIVRAGLRALLEAQDGFTVVGDAADGRRAIELSRTRRADVAVMDIGMSGLNGIDATRQIVNHGGNVRVVALSVHSERPLVRRMLEAGASGYLLKSCAIEELCDAVRTVVGGRTYLSPTLGDVHLDEEAGDAETTTSPLTVLTPREREVLQLLAEGLSAKSVAFRLGIAVKTVETHRKNLTSKLGIYSVAELTKLAVREGLTSLDR